MFLVNITVFFGIFVEILNPHSFLTTTGFFIRSMFLLVILVIYIWYLRKTKSYSTTVIIFLTIASSLYFWYGINSFCQNKYWEETESNADVGNKKYSCHTILEEHLF